MPKPKSKYSYCSVCKDDYHDYLEVIQNIFSIFNPNLTKPA